MSSELIETRAELASLVPRLAGATRIGIDLEGDGLFRYRARLCTMQLRVEDEIILVDTLAAWDPELMGEVLGPDGPVKVIHDAAFDARLLRDHGVALGHVFDTALAARYLGEPATGLAALVKAHCGEEIDKGPQQADWGARPLDQDALRYLRADVQHLFTLHDELAGRLDSTGIRQEYTTEVGYMLGQAHKPPATPGPPWRRIKGAMDLDPVGQAVLRELALVREQAAQDADVPVFRILHDRVLQAIAQRKPRDLAGLRRVRGAANGRAAGIQPALLAAIARGREARSVPAEEAQAGAKAVPPPELRALKKARHAALTAWRRGTAEARGVDAQVVLPGHCLQDLCALPAQGVVSLSDIEGLGTCRVARDGDAMLAVLDEVRTARA